MFHFLSNYLKRTILTPILHSTFFILSIRHSKYSSFPNDHDSHLLHAVHHQSEWLREADVTHVFGFFHGFEGIEDVFSEYAFIAIWVHGEVTHTERSEVLEEVGAL